MALSICCKVALGAQAKLMANVFKALALLGALVKASSQSVASFRQALLRM